MTNYTFQGDTTYYISSSVRLYGTNTFEGGTVIKYANTNSAGIYVYGPINCLTGPYRPAIFTAKDDNTVGESISGSTGAPLGYYANPALAMQGNAPNISYFRIAYAQLAISAVGTTNSIKNGQIINCQNGIYAIVVTTVNLENLLFNNVQTDLYNLTYVNNIYVQNSTFNLSSNLTSTTGSYQTVMPYFTNCIFANISQLTNSPGEPGLTYGVAGANNGFYNAPFFGSSSEPGYPYPFQTVGGGSFYLATNSNFHNYGTANIDPTLLASLKQKTTWPPQVYPPQTISSDFPLSPQAPRDTNSNPDLGYHYDPIDYAFSGVVVANATVTVGPGTVIGTFGTNGSPYGLSIGTGAQLICEGAAYNLNRIVTYNTVQEGPGGGWQAPTLASVTDYIGGAGGMFDFQFTDWSMFGPANASHLIIDQSNPVNMRDCQFHGGSLVTFLGPTINLTNCLFDRVDVVLNPTDGNIPVLRNNLFYGGTLDLLPFGTSHSLVQDNLFDRTTILDHNPPCTYTGYNAYVTNCNRLQPTTTYDIILTNSPAYQTGPLGAFYQPTNSPLIDKGSENVDAAGLTGYTILTNQSPDTGTVDMGYHYKIIGNDSTGTDFWLAFFSIEVQGEQYLPVDQSLYISSSVAASGTVTCPVNGPVLTITGDPAVNGTYILTNMPASETNDFIGSTMYVNEANTNLQVVPMQFAVRYYYYWAIWNYNPSNGFGSIYYYKNDPYLNGTNWVPYYGTSADLVISCPQVLFSQPFSMIPGMVTNVPLPQDTMLYQFDAVESQGIHVTASQPVSVYGFDYYQAASTAFTAYPTPMLGTNYCVMARASSIFGKPYHSQFAVVGTVTNTTVTITPSTTANLAGSMWTNSFILNQGNTYQINSSNIEGDVTGTRITSDKPIAVFAGADLAFVPGQSTQTGNPLNQEQLPVEQWGTNVVSMSFAGRLGDTFRVLAAYSNTVVTISGIVVTNSNGSYGGTNYAVVTTNRDAGQFYETILLGPAQFQSTKPIQVAQFGNGYQFDNPPNFDGDPCEILLPPTGRYLATSIVATPPNDDMTGDFDENFLNLMVPQSATNSTWVDGTLVSVTNYIAIGTSGYYGAQITITNSGAHSVTSSQPVGVEVYGWGLTDAYGYFGGIVK
jgi:hypothetical protein